MAGLDVGIFGKDNAGKSRGDYPGIKAGGDANRENNPGIGTDVDRRIGIDNSGTKIDVNIGADGKTGANNPNIGKDTDVGADGGT